VSLPRRAAPHHQTRRPQLARGADGPRSWRWSGTPAAAIPSAVTCAPFDLPGPASDAVGRMQRWRGQELAALSDQPTRTMPAGILPTAKSVPRS